MTRLLGYRLSDLAWLTPADVIAMCEPEQERPDLTAGLDSHFTI